VGQEDVVRILQEAIARKSVRHAYLFTGSRGTGKTTLARIFARAIGTNPEDLYEIDAASQNKIEDVRDLREAVRTVPFSSPKKVYILDEVHMLSKSAWNALLKTLEEPPEHVVFILATTELDRVPDTVLSRCQVINFRQPSVEVLREYITRIAHKEDVSLDRASCEVVAIGAAGSFRDALSLFEKVLMLAKNGKADPEDVARIVGAPTNALLSEVLRSFSEGNASIGLAAISAAVERQVDMGVFLRLLLRKVRAILLLRYAPAHRASLESEFTPDDLQMLERYAKDALRTINSHTIVTLLDASRSIGWSEVPSLPLELAVIAIAGEKIAGTQPVR
jgi:DNA polymerase-3 subunit gamma/tau